jgi:large subunit ribosomal protein L32
MGGVPKKRHTKGSRNQRRMHIFATSPALSKCKKCGKPVLPHSVCPNCGFYKGKEVIDVMAKLTKKEKKLREKEMKAKGKLEGKEQPPGAENKQDLSWENLSKR